LSAAASAAVFFHAATAARVEVELHGHRDPNQPADKLVPVTVCEDDTIWDKVMASPDMNGIRAIPWKEITESISGYLEQESILAEAWEKEIESLKAEIKKKKETEASVELNQEQIQHLISQSLETPESFVSLQNARSSGCGKPGREPRLSSGAYYTTLKKMPDLAKTLLSTGEYKTVKKDFIDWCKDLLEVGDEDEMTNYCGQLCVELADVAQGISDQHSNSVPSTIVLDKKLAERRAELLALRVRQEQCTRSKDNIDNFHEYLDKLDADIKIRHKAVREAERELVEAQWALDGLQKQLTQQKNELGNTLSALEGTQQEVMEAKEALGGLEKDIDVIMKQISKARTLLEKLHEELTNMKKAKEVILEIKKYVSATTLKMGYYVDMAVRDPVRSIGLVEETKVWDYFSEDVSKDQCAEDFKVQLMDFHAYCTGPAMSAFEKIKHIVDLTPLCQVGDEDEIGQEEVASVQHRINLLTEDLRNVQSWLDPFRGTHMTKSQEKEKVGSGEPEGLRHIQGVFSQGNFYTGYLAEWKWSQGKFHGLLASVNNSVQELETKLATAVATDKDLTDNLERLGTEQLAAQEKLKAASAQETTLLGDKQALEEAQARLEGEVSQSKQLLADLQAALDRALAAYFKATKELVSEHTNQKGEVFALSQVHEEVMLDM